MKSRVEVLGSPLHPVMIVFPVSLWIASLVCDIVLTATGDPVWQGMAFWTMAFGWVGATLAAAPGMIDYFTVTPEGGKPGTYGMVHGLINVSLLILYAFNLGLRLDGTASAGEFWVTLALSVVGVALLGVSGWLGIQVAHVYGSSVAGISQARGTDQEEEERRAA